jgi:hypothetical protein
MRDARDERTSAAADGELRRMGRGRRERPPRGSRSDRVHAASTHSDALRQRLVAEDEDSQAHGAQDRRQSIGEPRLRHGDREPRSQRAKVSSRFLGNPKPNCLFEVCSARTTSSSAHACGNQRNLHLEVCKRDSRLLPRHAARDPRLTRRDRRGLLRPPPVVRQLRDCLPSLVLRAWRMWRALRASRALCARGESMHIEAGSGNRVSQFSQSLVDDVDRPEDPSLRRADRRSWSESDCWHMANRSA